MSKNKIYDFGMGFEYEGVPEIEADCCTGCIFDIDCSCPDDAEEICAKGDGCIFVVKGSNAYLSLDVEEGKDVLHLIDVHLHTLRHEKERHLDDRLHVLADIDGARIVKYEKLLANLKGKINAKG